MDLHRFLKLVIIWIDTLCCEKKNENRIIRLQAVELGNLELVKLFWDEKLNKSQADYKGYTALHLAVMNGFYKIIEFLVKNSESIDIPNKVSESLSFKNSWNHKTEVVNEQSLCICKISTSNILKRYLMFLCDFLTN